MAKAVFIPKHEKMKCWSCRGVGTVPNSKGEKCECKPCNGTGIWLEKNFILVYTDSKGQKHGFMVDGLK